MSSPPPQPQLQPQPQPQTTNDPSQGASVVEQRLVRRLMVEVIDARDLLPKDGQGSSSPYVVVDFDNQRRKTTTKYRDLNPVWNEPLEFIVSDPNTMDFEELNVEVYHVKRMTPSGAARENIFLGRVKLYGSEFSRRGDEGLVYFPLEKKSVFSWIKGELGLRIYYYDEVIEVPIQQGEGPPPPEVAEVQPEPRKEEEQQGRVVEMVSNQPTDVTIEEEDGEPVEPESRPASSDGTNKAETEDAKTSCIENKQDEEKTEKPEESQQKKNGDQVKGTELTSSKQDNYTGKPEDIKKEKTDEQDVDSKKPIEQKGGESGSSEQEGKTSKGSVIGKIAENKGILIASVISFTLGLLLSQKIHPSSH